MLPYSIHTHCFDKYRSQHIHLSAPWWELPATDFAFDLLLLSRILMTRNVSPQHTTGKHSLMGTDMLILASHWKAVLHEYVSFVTSMWHKIPKHRSVIQSHWITLEKYIVDWQCWWLTDHASTAPKISRVLHLLSIIDDTIPRSDNSLNL